MCCPSFAEEWWKSTGRLLILASKFWRRGLVLILPWAMRLAAWTTALLSGHTYVGFVASIIQGEHCSTAACVATASISQGLQNCIYGRSIALQNCTGSSCDVPSMLYSYGTKGHSWAMNGWTFQIALRAGRSP